MFMIHYLLPLLSLLLSVVIGCTLISRTGHPWWLGLLILVPLANLGLMLFLLIRACPVEEELSERRLAAGVGIEEDARRVMGLAGRRARQGRKTDAGRLYQLIEQQFAGSVAAHDAAIARGQLGGVG